MESITKDKNQLETEKGLNAKILSITMLIKEKYPELYGFLGEMTETIPDDKGSNNTIKVLKDYLDSLEAMIKKYGIEHPLN